ncbi:uncharacterized protein PAC_16320 [Phialocephala subalpina]|uniref:Heterokaryon incompatibility domain-containing protein n=1 Tax=Phialocephala subalpina TaxID=576137 RepID=A0A1L7XN06_9HELO|nr:uncharacterized protein PAC_16320 [Phialocephala subalpina]
MNAPSERALGNSSRQFAKRFPVGEDSNTAAEINDAGVEEQGSQPHAGPSFASLSLRINSVNSRLMISTQHETEMQDEQSHDDGNEEPDGNEDSESDEKHESSPKTDDDPSSPLLDSSIKVFGPRENRFETSERYSWPAWLESAQAIEDDDAIFTKGSYEDWGNTCLTIQPKEDYGTNPDIIDGLCVMCRWILDHLRLVFNHLELDIPNFTDTMNIKHWSTSLLLVQAANKGCGLCDMLVSACKPEPPSSAGEWHIRTKLHYGHSEGLSLSVEWDPEDEEYHTELDLFPVDATKSDVQEAIGSPELDVALHWLYECERKHTFCKRRGGNFKLPSRLLEIQPGSIRLRAVFDNRSNTKYATLSHCWGPSGVNFKLTKASLANFQDNIRQDFLPKTFQDAILITRILGIQYLWIDSLCIIQDDPEDWLKESVTMSEVYGNSYVNIAASWAENSNGGCFYSHDAKVKRLQVNAKVRKDEKVYFQTLEVVPTDMVRKSISRSVLASRGWVLQERLLSPRTLHFTDSQLFWECDTQLACESFPNGIPVLAARSDEHIEKGNLPDQWDRIVLKYTDCRLTQRRDVLVALSGIIRKLQEHRRDICFAGIWRQDPKSQLLWRRQSPFVEEVQGLYTAPTWSWAASPGQVRPLLSRSVSLAYQWAVEILDMEVISIGKDHLGELCGGSLSIACRSLLQAKVLFQLQVDRDNDFKVVGFELTNRAQSACTAFWDTMKSNYLDIFLLPFHYQPEHRVLGLILVPAGTSGCKYRRVGCFGGEFYPFQLGKSHDFEQYGFENPVDLKDVIEDTRYTPEGEAFASVITHGDEQWGVINII